MNNRKLSVLDQLITQIDHGLDYFGPWPIYILVSECLAMAFLLLPICLYFGLESYAQKWLQ